MHGSLLIFFIAYVKNFFGLACLVALQMKTHQWANRGH